MSTSIDPGALAAPSGAERPFPRSSEVERVAVVIPCHNEEGSVGKVVEAFRRELPEADVVVVDNASTDATRSVAAEAGARVVCESRLGKGYALLRGFEAVRGADYLVMVDGDDTYPAERVGAMLELARRGADMVVGTRLEEAASGAFRRGHDFGNRLFIWLVRMLFGMRTTDLFSGYRVFTRRFLRTVPVIAQGFEVEAELSVQALVHGFTVAELPVEYRARRVGSESKLRTLRDGPRILRALFLFFRDNRPLALFGNLSLVLLALSLAGGGVVIAEFLRTGLVPRLPLAVLAAALFILSALSFTCGVLLSSINRRAAELSALVRQHGGSRRGDA